MAKPIHKAIFPVAGRGTRFLPATKVLAKEMFPIVDKPLIQYAVEEARDAGIGEFLFITSRGKAALVDHFDHAVELEQALRERGDEKALQSVLPPSGRIFSTRQQELLGLGHAVLCAREFVGDEAFAVLLADDLILAEPGCLKQMMGAYEEVGGNVVACEDVPRELTCRYGILDVVKDDGRLASARGLVEKPDPAEAPSTLSIIGRYILQPEIFRYLERREVGAGNEIQLTDSLARTIGEIPFHGLRFQGKRFDCGNNLGFLEANLAFALERQDLGPRVHEMLKRYR